MKVRWYLGANVNVLIQPQGKLKVNIKWETPDKQDWVSGQSSITIVAIICLHLIFLLSVVSELSIRSQLLIYSLMSHLSFFPFLAQLLFSSLWQTLPPSSPNSDILSKHVSPSATHRAHSHDWEQPRFPKRPQCLDSHKPTIHPHVRRQAVQEPYSTRTRLHYPLGS